MKMNLKGPDWIPFKNMDECTCNYFPHILATILAMNAFHLFLNYWMTPTFETSDGMTDQTFKERVLERMEHAILKSMKNGNRSDSEHED